MPLINIERISVISSVLKDLGTTLLRFKFNVFDPRYYPPATDPPDKVILYFLVMVSMDHRLSRPGKPYEAFIDGEKVKGADLLYRLGMKMYREKPEFFNPENLARVTEEEVLAWLTVNHAKPPDPQLRALLLRDLGQKLLSIYSGNPLSLLRLSRGYLRAVGGYGLLELLKVFKAYQDPVEKKAFLLVKFLTYRNLFKPKDEEHLHVPVDNHLTRIALRLGIVELEEKLFEKVLTGAELTHDEDVLIRICVREAFKAVSRESNIDVFLLDDFLWSFGRKVCLQENPQCSACPCREVCKAYKTGVLIKDLNYYNTWYY
jgi:hypothetical protein